MSAATYAPTAAPRELLACEAPAARADSFGVAALSDVEALALLLHGRCRGGEQQMAAARDLLRWAGSASALAGKTPAEVTHAGFTAGIAYTVAAFGELSRRAQVSPERPKLDRPELIAREMRPLASGLTVEKFWVLCLDRKNRLVRTCEISSGTATSTLAHPREVFRAAFMHSASAIVCVHNHPSGDPSPSSADTMITRLLREAARAVDVPVLDHIILGEPAADPMGRGHFSFREAGLL